MLFCVDHPHHKRLHVKPTILTLAGSARRDALNKQLARIAAEQASGQGAEGAFIDLADYPLPLYDGDFEQSGGIPNNAVQLAELIKEADGLLIASPEYNGAYTPLLKNTNRLGHQSRLSGVRQAHCHRQLT